MQFTLSDRQQLSICTSHSHARVMILDLYEEFWLRTWGNIIYIIPAFYKETMQTLILCEACMGDACLLKALPSPFHKFTHLPP